jgi:ketosteroid isomerase-like protein
MKQMTTVTTLSFLLLCCAGISLRGADAASDTAEVWSGEEAYWHYLQSHDAEHFVDLWSDDFVGWPMREDHPIHKADIASGFQSANSFGHVISYELHRESVEMHGPVGITFYRATVRRRIADGSEPTTNSRLTHTWMKHDGKWQIVGGMSAADAPLANSR